MFSLGKPLSGEGVVAVILFLLGILLILTAFSPTLGLMLFLLIALSFLLFVGSIRRAGYSVAYPLQKSIHSYDEYLVRKEVEEMAMQVVMDYEWMEGRWARDVSDRNLGYDIESGSFGEVRYIEVKGLSGMYSRIALTENEYFTGRRLRGSYFIYVVTNLRSDYAEPELHIIDNPHELPFIQSNGSYILEGWKRYAVYSVKVGHLVGVAGSRRNMLPLTRESLSDNFTRNTGLEMLFWFLLGRRRRRRRRLFFTW